MSAAGNLHASSGANVGPRASKTPSPLGLAPEHSDDVRHGRWGRFQLGDRREVLRRQGAASGQDQYPERRRRCQKLTRDKRCDALDYAVPPGSQDVRTDETSPSRARNLSHDRAGPYRLSYRGRSPVLSTVACVSTRPSQRRPPIARPTSFCPSSAGGS